MIVVDTSVWVDFFSGRPTPEADALNELLAGTFCILNRLPLLHADRDFDALEERLGLVVYRGCS